MRRLRLQMQISVDGYNAAGPDDEQKWVTWDLDGVRSHVIDLLDSADTILIGRKLAVDYIPYWIATEKNPDDPMHDMATRIVAARKIVFTRTLTESAWQNTELASGDLVDEVMRLKAEPGKDIIVYGGSSFVASLIREGLVDEFNLFMNPIALGSGASAFSELTSWQSLELKSARPLTSGVILLTYDRA